MNETPSVPPTRGGRLRAARLSAGLTQAQLAARMGITPGAVYQAESGRCGPPSLDALLRYAEAIGCDPSELDAALAPRRRRRRAGG